MIERRETSPELSLGLWSIYHLQVGDEGDGEGVESSNSTKDSLGEGFGRRLNTLSREAKHMQYLIAVTSTLGGANHLCNKPRRAMEMALRQEAVGIRLGATSIVIRSRVFQAVNLALLGRSKECRLMFRDCLRKAEASRDDGIIAFTKAVYGWLVREHRHEKQRLENSKLIRDPD
jgi:hypothetical protein